MINNRKFLGWVGKLLLLAVPAAISGYASYAKSKVEADAKATASYETLQKAFAALSEDHEVLLKRFDAFEGQSKEKETRTVYLRPPPVKLGPAPPMVLLVPDAGTDGDGIGLGSLGVLGRGAGGSHHKKRAELPAKFEDAVQQYKVEEQKNAEKK